MTAEFKVAEKNLQFTYEISVNFNFCNFWQEAIAAKKIIIINSFSASNSILALPELMGT